MPTSKGLFAGLRRANKSSDHLSREDSSSPKSSPVLHARVSRDTREGMEPLDIDRRLSLMDGIEQRRTSMRDSMDLERRISTNDSESPVASPRIPSPPEASPNRQNFFSLPRNYSSSSSISDISTGLNGPSLNQHSGSLSAHSSLEDVTSQTNALSQPPSPTSQPKQQTKKSHRRSVSLSLSQKPHTHAHAIDPADSGRKTNIIYRIFHPGRAEELHSHTGHSDTSSNGSASGTSPEAPTQHVGFFKAFRSKSQRRSKSISNLSDIVDDGSSTTLKKEGSHSNLLKEMVHRQLKDEHQNQNLASPPLNADSTSPAGDSDANSDAQGSPQSASANVAVKEESKFSFLRHRRNESRDSLKEVAHGSDGEEKTIHRSTSDCSLSEKYGKPERVLGKGANATVRLAQKMNGCKIYAVKEFRKKRKDETQKEYVKKLVAEFCISSSLHHENIVETVDLIQDEQMSGWCEVMEFCAGGDLFGRLQSNTLTDPAEINCYWRQLINGVAYLHSMGVAHRDLKPENLLIDCTGRVLKITDFGTSYVFRDPFSTKETARCKGVCGSTPYIAPEEFIPDTEYEPTAVDVWAVGIIYYVVVYNSMPWRCARREEPHYRYYLQNRNKFWPIDRLAPGLRKLMYRILEPDPKKRITIEELKNDEWVKGIEHCSLAMAEESTTNGSVGHTHPKPELPVTLQGRSFLERRKSHAHKRSASSSVASSLDSVPAVETIKEEPKTESEQACAEADSKGVLKDKTNNPESKQAGEYDKALATPKEDRSLAKQTSKPADVTPDVVSAENSVPSPKS